MIFLQKGDIVLALFPFTDLSQTKLRPAVVLWADVANQDITICFVSSQGINQVSADEFVLQPSDSAFMATGLKVVSKVRVTKIVTLARKLITRRLGNLENTYSKFQSSEVQ
jgi:mRNA interferase MazF